jgi:hypothetical protein
MAWQVEVTDEFTAWYEGLDPEQQDRVNAAIDELEERGPALGRPWVDTLAGSKLANLKELRVHRDGHLRILFVFDPRRTAILLLGGDKTRQWAEWYRWAIPEAERLYDMYLEELRREGLLP